MEPMKATSVNSRAEELFVQLFCEAFGPEKTENLQVQYPCVDIYGRHRYIDFALESPESKIAIEIDGETYHNPSKVSENKYADDLLKQNKNVFAITEDKEGNVWVGTDKGLKRIETNGDQIRVSNR